MYGVCEGPALTEQSIGTASSMSGLPVLNMSTPVKATDMAAATAPPSVEKSEKSQPGDLDVGSLPTLDMGSKQVPSQFLSCYVSFLHHAVSCSLSQLAAFCVHRGLS